MYKKGYEMLDSLSEYAKDNRKYQEVLSNKRVELEKNDKIARVVIPILGIILVLLCIFALHEILAFFNAETIGSSFLHLFKAATTSTMLVFIYLAFVYILSYGCKELFNYRDLDYVNMVLKEETHTLHKTDFRYINSHEIAVNFHGKDHIFDTDIINVDDSKETVIIESSLQIVEGKLEVVVEFSNKNEI